MTKKHFNRMAELIRHDVDIIRSQIEGVPRLEQSTRLAGLETAAVMFCALAREFNPKFSHSKFMEACGFLR
jgi:hypothetical protein